MSGGYWWWPSLFGPSDFQARLSNNTATQTCTSWYGHSFQKFDSATIYCPTCGLSKTVKP